jgi:hypothetical protein
METLAEIQSSVSGYANPSRNLFDYSRAVEGFYLSQDGGLSAAPGFGVSGLIPVTPGSTYVGTDGVTVGAMRFTCFFAADGATVVPGGSGSSVSLFTAPAGAVYVRVTYNIGFSGIKPFNARTFQFEAGSTPTPYVPYQGGLKNTVSVYPGSVRAICASVNLFDAQDARDGFYIDNNNSIASNPSFGYSGYIAVTPGMKYVCSDAVGEANGLVASNQTMRFVCYYDAEKNPVAGGSAGSTYAVTVPAGVYFLRFSYNITTANGLTSGKNSIQFQAGTAATKYVPFSYEIVTAKAFLPQSTNSPIWGAERLRRFHAWKRVKDYSYDLVLQGDSWTDGTYYAKQFKSIMDGKTSSDGGPGLLSFAFADGPLASSSIDSSKLAANWATGDWVSVVTGSWGVSGTHVVSQGTGKTITITAAVELASLRLIYRMQSGQGGFSYSINGGASVAISNSAANSIGSTLIDTSMYPAGFTLVITSAAAVEFSGAVGRAAGANQLTIHKAAMTGSRAHQFARQPLFPQSLALLAPKGACFMWGTNEINANTPPQVMKAHIQNMVNYYRALDPMCDLIFMSPGEQTYGTEAPRSFVTSDYADAMFQLAQENHGCYVNLRAVFGPFGQYLIDGGFMHADRVHPGARGGPLIAETLASAFLLGQI